MSQTETRRGFFAVDVRCFRKACCDINMATAYLVMACGTGADNGTTSWSVNAIERYTRISRRRAKTAIEQLIGARLAVQVKQGSHPQYRLLSWQEINESEISTASLASVLEKIKSGAPLSKENVKTARHLVSRGLAVEETFGQFKLAKHEPQLSWLPNTFVCGADGETAMVMRCFFALPSIFMSITLKTMAASQRASSWGQYDRKLRASVDAYQIFEFQHTNLASYGRGPVAAHLNVKPDGQKDFQPFWERISKLTYAGVIEWIPTLFENQGEIVEPIMPLEDQLGSAAHAAAACLLARYYNLASIPESWQGPSPNFQLVPVPQHFEQATLFKIARLRYRRHTERTAQWFSRVARLGAEYLETYSQIVADFALSPRKSDAA